VTSDSKGHVEDLLKSDDEVVFLLRGDLCFEDCSPAWDSFAAENGGSNISREEMRGRNVLDFVPGVLRTFYEQKYWFVQSRNSREEFDYHCSSPEKIRLFRMSIQRLKAGFLVVNRLALQEECEVRPPLEPQERQSYVAPNSLLTMCANCRKVRWPADQTRWDWVPEFLNETGLKITHGLCPRCITLVYGDLLTAPSGVGPIHGH